MSLNHHASRLRRHSPGPTSPNRIRLRIIRRWFAFAVAGFLLAIQTSFAAVQISELLAANDAGLLDEDGDSSDWIELHNSGPSETNLDGWYLTDDATDLRKWRLPAVSLPGGAYLVIFASAKDRAPVPGELHTNFNLDGDGEYLALVRPDGVTVEFEYAPTFPRQRRDMAYGIADPASPATPLYFPTPTPGAQNSGGILGFVADTKFSVDRGYFTNAFDVEITCATPGATIRVTTDFSTPSPTHGSVYSGPIRVDRTTVLRAMAYDGALLPSDVDTQTYLFLDTIVQQPDLPAGWPATWTGGYRDYEMDPDIVNSPTYASRIGDALQDLPIIALTTDMPNLFGSSGIYDNPTQDGVLWEKQASVEIFYPDGRRGDLQVNCGLRIQGGASRQPAKSGKHSFRLLFKDLYGPTKLRHNLFGGDAVREFDTVVLRAGFNQSWIHHNTFKGDNRGRAQYARDQWAKNAQRAMGGLAPHNGNAHLFLNGLYWGMYNPSERPQASWAAAYLGGSKEDYDALNSGAIIDGNTTAWVELFNRAALDLSIDANYQHVLEMLDLDAFIDYMILHQYGGNQDWDSHNWYAFRRRALGARWRFASWDSEFIFIDPSGSSSLGRIEGDYAPPDNRGPLELQRRLDDHPEFRIRFADRVHEHLFNTGALTHQNVTNLWLQQITEIDRAIIGESARWGDFRRDVLPSGSFYSSDGLYDRDEEWFTELTRLMTTYFPVRGGELIQAYRNRNPQLYPNVDAPEFNQHGGAIPYGFSLAVQNPNGSGNLYLTLDGSDPRLPGGGVASSAMLYGGALTLNESTLVRARVRVGATWSAVCQAVFTVPDAPPLRITEIMYNPAPPTTAEVSAGHADNDDFEYIELLNTGSASLDLRDFRFVRGLQFDFAQHATLQELAPGERVLLVHNAAAFQTRYGTTLPIAGAYTNRLSNAGETLRLDTQLGQAVLDFDFNDTWYPSTDGEGFALEIIDPAGPRADWGKRPSWRATWASGGTPGTDDPNALNPESIVINESLTHTDASAVGDWIELHNRTGQAIDIGGWYLSDSEANLQKYRIAPGTILPAGGFATFSQNLNFGPGAPDPGALEPFGLSELGETLLLSAAVGSELRGYREIEAFGPAAREIAFARHVKSTGKTDFTAASANTPAAANAAPLVGPIVVNEIMYHPLDGESEFLELLNVAAVPVPLFDVGYPSNTWQLASAVQFDFPQNTTIAPGQLFLVVPLDPAVFRATYNIPAEIPIFGPYLGALDNAGEDLHLTRPGSPEPGGFVPRILVDRVNYKDGDRWPAAADGTGPSLRRLNPYAYGNDAGNWDVDVDGGSPGNLPPTVDAGPDQTVDLTATTITITLNGTATDDGLPTNPGTLTLAWSRISGPGNATIASPSNATTSVQLDTGGSHVFRLGAFDGAHTATDDLTVIVVPPPPKDLLLQESDGITAVTEGGEPDTYTVQLSSAPAPGTDVVVQITTRDDRADVNPAELRFTVSTWNEPQTVNISVDDDAVDLGHTYTDAIVHTVISGDPSYHRQAVADIIVHITDNDTLSAGWPYRMRIAFPGYTAPETLVDFPVLVRLSPALPGFSYSQFTDPNGGDLRFTDAARSTELSYEIEEWNPAGTSTVWVRVPALSPATTTLWAFWGQAGLATPPASADGSTWTNAFLGVWHLHDSEDDASPQRNHATAIEATATAGIVSQGRHFNGSSSYLRIDSVARDIPTTDFTAGGWVRTTRATKQMLMSINTSSGGNVWRIAIGDVPAGSGAPSVGDGSADECVTGFRIDDGSWHQLVYTRSGVTGRLFIDGQERATHTADFTFNSDDLWVIGQEYDGGPTPSDFLNGDADEPRIAAVARSAAWIQAEWLNLAQPDAFSQTSAVQTGDLPTANLSPLVISAYELGQQPANFEILLDQPASADLPIHFQIGGDALAGADYVALTSPSIVTADTDRLSLSIQPIPDSDAEGIETVEITLVPDAAYQLGPTNRLTLTITPLPLDAWRVLHFPDPNAPEAQPEADFDQDHAPNLLEYALATDPTRPAEFPMFGFVSDAPWPTVTYTRRTDLPDAEVTVQFSTNLLSSQWIWGTQAVTEQVVQSDGSTQRIHATIIDPARSHQGVWGARMRVTTP